MTDTKPTPTVLQSSDEDLSNMDIFLYSGTISYDGFISLAKDIEQRVVDDVKNDAAVLILNTFGGDPHAGYKIARMLQKEYKRFLVAIPEKCKSAGTLIAIAADEIIFGSLGELGPLDIQLRKKDEIGEQSSTLDIFKALDNLQSRVIESFRHYVTDIKYGSGVNTKLASDIASTLSESLIKPLSAQIDPIKLGEQKRALSIAKEYSYRLNQSSENLKDGALNQLIEGYPSHSFVIDLEESKTLFKRVRSVQTEIECMLNGIALRAIDVYREEIQIKSFVACDFTQLAKQLLAEQASTKDDNVDSEPSEIDQSNVVSVNGE
ncbi:hypothetical protein L1D59_22500 [Pseudoalteromonas piscicida]|uniref:SDH family Clp fold serine proteinase n=1 Tax=Pseudoalteromonas piscicida TaxID=43662 RepID=UPI001EFDF32D|nr:hypothetical protein [Pseudoalteromonas piscicida]MCG9771375.1 hypothetical protein [Pseudoalteromonas piscicida]